LKKLRLMKRSHRELSVPTSITLMTKFPKSNKRKVSLTKRL